MRLTISLFLGVGENVRSKAKSPCWRIGPWQLLVARLHVGLILTRQPQLWMGSQVSYSEEKGSSSSQGYNEKMVSKTTES